jgi:hypothetical protein
MSDIDMGGKFEGYDVVLLGRVGDKEVYSMSPTTGGAGPWLTFERTAGGVDIGEIVKATEMVSAHSAWLKYLMERSIQEDLPGSHGFGFGAGGDADV